MNHWGKMRHIFLSIVMLWMLTGCETLVTQPTPDSIEEPETVLEPEPALEIEPEPVPQEADTSADEPVKPPPVVDEELLVAQKTLKDMGLYSGQLDGIYGPKTRKALLDYQYWNGLALTGELDLQTKISLEQQ